MNQMLENFQEERSSNIYSKTNNKAVQRYFIAIFTKYVDSVKK